MKAPGWLGTQASGKHDQPGRPGYLTVTILRDCSASAAQPRLLSGDLKPAR